MTGIRSWTGAVTALALVVKIVHVSRAFKLRSFQVSHNPANENSSPRLKTPDCLCDFPGHQTLKFDLYFLHSLRPPLVI
jgi:hypothetical protein